MTLSEKTELDAPRSAPVQPVPLLKPPVTPVLSLPLWSPASVPAAPPAPVERTINVTIGRIEIRAPHATASVKRTASAVPEVSLETYLKQRNQSQGGRR